MHSDDFLDIVADQVLNDVSGGDITALFGLLDSLPRDVLVAYLSTSNLQKALKRGIVAQEEADDQEMESYLRGLTWIVIKYL